MMKKIIFTILLVVFLLTRLVVDVSAQTPTGIGVIGDSQSRPYRCVGYGNSTSFNYVEYGRALRGLNFGTGTTCASYVKAWGGHTVQANMAGQVTSLLNDINAGNILKVFIMLGHNDVHNPNPAPNLVPTILDIYEAQLNRILDAGISPSNILMVGVLPSTYPPTQQNVANYNAGLALLASEYGTNYMPFPLTVKTYIVGGETINVCYSNEYHCLFLGSPGYGHTGSVGNGLLFNAFASFFGVSPLSDAEILSLPQGGNAPTSTPAASATMTRTATVTRTPTTTNTPQPTATPTPHILDCGSGKHWIPIPNDAQRVECVPNSARQPKPSAYGFQVVSTFANFGIPRCEGEKPCKKEYTDKANPCRSRFSCPFVP